MLQNMSKLNIVRVGSYITYGSLKEIGNKVVHSFRGLIEDFKLAHYDAPAMESIDAYFLTMILQEAFGGHTLGITDADLKTSDADEFYSSIIGGKNPQSDVAVVSTRKLSPCKIESQKDYDLYISRTTKVSLHEIGHNLGLTDHASYRAAPDGTLCPMSKGEFNKFGFLGYIRAIIDGRGLTFCDECTNFLRRAHGFHHRTSNVLKDGLNPSPGYQNKNEDSALPASFIRDLILH